MTSFCHFIRREGWKSEYVTNQRDTLYVSQRSTCLARLWKRKCQSLFTSLHNLVVTLKAQTTADYQTFLATALMWEYVFRIKSQMPHAASRTYLIGHNTLTTIIVNIMHREIFQPLCYVFFFFISNTGLWIVIHQDQLLSNWDVLTIWKQFCFMNWCVYKIQEFFLLRYNISNRKLEKTRCSAGFIRCLLHRNQKYFCQFLEFIRRLYHCTNIKTIL